MQALASSIEAVIQSFDWNKLYTAHGDAAMIPERLRNLILAGNEAEVKHWYWLVDNVIVVQGGVYESAPACVSVFVEAIKSQMLTNIAKEWIYELILQTCYGYTATETCKRGNGVVAVECKAIVRHNLDLLISKNIPETDEILVAIHDRLNEKE